MVVITFLPRSKRLLISWLQSPSAVILEPRKIKSDTVSTVSPSIFHIVKWREVAQSWPTLCDPMDCSLPGSSVHGIFEAIVLEWIAISFSRGSSQPRVQESMRKTRQLAFFLVDLYILQKVTRNLESMGMASCYYLLHQITFPCAWEVCPELQVSAVNSHLVSGVVGQRAMFASKPSRTEAAPRAVSFR